MNVSILNVLAISGKQNHYETPVSAARTESASRVEIVGISSWISLYISEGGEFEVPCSAFVPTSNFLGILLHMPTSQLAYKEKRKKTRTY